MNKEFIKRVYDKFEEIDALFYKVMREGMTFENQFKIADTFNDYYKHIKETLKTEIDPVKILTPEEFMERIRTDLNKNR